MKCLKLYILDVRAWQESGGGRLCRTTETCGRKNSQCKATQSCDVRGKTCSHSPSWCVEEAAVGVCQIVTWFIADCLDSYRKELSVFKYQGVLSDVRVFFSWLHNTCYHSCCGNTIWEHLNINEFCWCSSLKMYHLTRWPFSEEILRLILRNQQVVHAERKGGKKGLKHFAGLVRLLCKKSFSILTFTQCSKNQHINTSR